MFGSFGFTEILIIMFALVLLFGAKKIPELAKGIGTGMKEFKKSLNDIQNDISLENDKLKK